MSLQPGPHHLDRAVLEGHSVAQELDDPGRVGASVYQDLLAVGGGNERGVPLAHINKDDMQPGVG